MQILYGHLLGCFQLLQIAMSQLFVRGMMREGGRQRQSDLWGDLCYGATELLIKTKLFEYHGAKAPILSHEENDLIRSTFVIQRQGTLLQPS